MIERNWTPEEEDLLIVKFKNLNGNYELMAPFFPKRNKEAMRRKINKLKNDTKRFESITIEHEQSPVQNMRAAIKTMISSEMPNDKLLGKIMKMQYPIEILIEIIAELSIEESLLCFKLANTFKYLVESIQLDLISILFQICREIMPVLFMQNCCILHIFEYEDVISNIPEFADIRYFNSIPNLKFKTQEDHLEKARLIKK